MTPPAAPARSVPSRAPAARSAAQIDPTANVLALVAAAVERLDDLAQMRETYAQDRTAREIKRLDDLRVQSERHRRDVDELRNKLEAAESRRIDALLVAESRRIDALLVAESRRLDALLAAAQSAVGLATTRTELTAAALAERVDTSAKQLAAQVETSARALAAQVEATAKANEAAVARTAEALAGRIIPLEQARYEQAGRSGLSAPLLMVLAAGAGGIVIYILEQMLRATPAVVQVLPAVATAIAR